MQNRVECINRRLQCRNKSSSSNSNNSEKIVNQKNKEHTVGEEKLKWTERKEAPLWMKKISPTKGGTAPPTKKEALVIGIVTVIGVYAWFIDPGSMIVKAINHSSKKEKIEETK